MAAANDQLRAARVRIASPNHPDEGLTRQELAELVNAYIWDHHDQKMVALNANYLGKLERGHIRWPSRLYREALRAVLDVPTDTALGFVNARRAVVRLEAVDRQQFIRSSAALGVGALALGPVAALLAGSTPTPIPKRVGATEIEQTRAAAQVFKSWNFTYGGGLAREAVLAQLRWSASVYGAPPARIDCVPSCSARSDTSRTPRGISPSMPTLTTRPAAYMSSRWAAPSRPATGTCEPGS